MKEVYEEEVIRHTFYRAVDGTEFKDKEECIKYESSAKGVLLSKFMKLVVAEDNEWDLIRGNEDNLIYAVKMETEGDKDTVLQIYYIDHPYLLEKEYTQRKEKIEKLVEDTYNNKSILLFGKNLDDELYYIDSVKNIIDRLNLLGKNDSKTND